MNSNLPNRNTSPNKLLNQNDKHLRLIEKLVTDLEDLTKKLIEFQKQLPNEDNLIRDDSLELQKFCSKLEFLLQFNLKEKKGILSSNSSSSGLASSASSSNTNSNNTNQNEPTNSSNLMNAYSNREYWPFLVEVFKSSRSFQDAIKYVKNLNEIKTNLGRGRAFIRFCLHYHRLADAIQQLMMEDKVVLNWYQDKAVWFDNMQKNRIFQLLYDLNEVNFDILSKNNFELDTTWPSTQLNTRHQHSTSYLYNQQQLLNRNRTTSISSFSSFSTERDQADNTNLLSSTPLEMDDDIMFASLNTAANTNKQEQSQVETKSSSDDAQQSDNDSKLKKVDRSLNNSNENNVNLDQSTTSSQLTTHQIKSASPSIYDDFLYTNRPNSQHEDETNQEVKEKLLIEKLNLKEVSTSLTVAAAATVAVAESVDDLKNNTNMNNERTNSPPQTISIVSNSNTTTSSKQSNENSEYVMKLESQIKLLNEELNSKLKQNNELNGCLIKQTNFCEDLSEILKKSQEKNNDLDLTITKHLTTITSLHSDLESLKQEMNSLKFELSAKTIQEENLIKETLAQTQSINTLKQMCSDQEKTINQLKYEMNLIKENRNEEMETQSHECQRIQVLLQLKEEENYLLNDQIQKLSKSLDDERKQTSFLTNELNEIKTFYKKLNDKKTNLINQLEMDNNEIKKRLVKLIKEKADLWQKADNLEYENQLKNNAMWIDDANVSNCMQCSNTFGLMLRKHHCRICLKIYCYYCCNNWIEYNKNKLRVCKRCSESKEIVERFSQKDSELLPSTSVGMMSGRTSSLLNDSVVLNESNKTEGSLNNSSTIPSPSIAGDNDDVGDDDDDEDDDDPDINFEVRPERLNSILNSNEYNSSEEQTSIYQTNNNISQLSKSKSKNSSSASLNQQLKEIKNDEADEYDTNPEDEEDDKNETINNNNNNNNNNNGDENENRKNNKQEDDEPMEGGKTKTINLLSDSNATLTNNKNEEAKEEEEEEPGLIVRKKKFKVKKRSSHERNMSLTKQRSTSPKLDQLLSTNTNITNCLTLSSPNLALAYSTINNNPRQQQQQANLSENLLCFVPENAIDDYDTFAIVSQEEIDKIYDKK